MTLQIFNKLEKIEKAYKGKKKKPTPGRIKTLKPNENSLVKKGANGRPFVDIQKNLEDEPSMLISEQLVKTLANEFNINLDLEANSSDSESKDDTSSGLELKDQLIAITKAVAIVEQQIDGKELVDVNGEQVNKSAIEKFLDTVSETVKKAMGFKPNQEQPEGQDLNEDPTPSDEPQAENEDPIEKAVEAALEKYGLKPAASVDASTEDVTKGEVDGEESLDDKIKRLEAIEKSEKEAIEKQEKLQEDNVEKQARIEELEKSIDNYKKMRQGSIALDEEDVNKSQVAEDVKKQRETWQGSAIGDFVKEKSDSGVIN